MSSNWEHVRTLFQSALDRPAAVRASFLAEACMGDDVTRREVESLLLAYNASEGFLESPAIDDGIADVTEPSLELDPGDRIAEFEVVGSLGAGGMGQVYRARDHKLHRDVAIKLLPRALADDPDRLSRFERESRMLAALNHPHIATIHGFEHEGGLHALVMELVEGPTLGERLKGEALEVRQALAFARDLAGALEAAHGKGIVHRDLKPANIKFTASGSLKLLDFGVAKEITDPDVSGLSRLPPDTVRSTDGVIVGTCAYMSPEQARGLPVDKRTDVWAFGCLLFEMLSGRRAFPGSTAAETVKAVVESQPDWSALPQTTPDTIRRLLHRCLEKDPHRRVHDIADARIEIDDALEGDDIAAVPAGFARTSVRRVGLMLALAAAAMAAGWWLRSTIALEAPPLRVARSTWALPTGFTLSSAPAVSPDGRNIAFTASEQGQPPRLHVRALGALEARAIPGTEGAEHPFWSPDSRFVAYFVPGKLMKVAVDGGAPVQICAARGGRGGTWSANDIIVFAPEIIDVPLARVSANGGVVEPVTQLEKAQGDNSHRWPVFLPDGVHFLYFVRSLRPERRGIYLGRVDGQMSSAAGPFLQSESDTQYVSLDGDDGVLLSVASGHIEARGFDHRRLRLTGDPRRLEIPAGELTPYHAAMVGASRDVLTYVPAAIPYGQRFARVDRDGQNLIAREPRQVITWVRLSPDASRVAYQHLDNVSASLELWVEDLNRGTRVRATREGEAGLMPVWSPDGQRLAYLSGTLVNPTLVIASADGTGVPVTVPCPGTRCLPTDWSNAGLLATVVTDEASDVWILPAADGQKAQRLLTEPFVERDARFSPDGTLVAYVSGESGRPEIVVQRIKGVPGRDVISVGGDQPVWRRDGRELFFVDPQGALRVVAVSQGAGGRLVIGRPIVLDVPPIGFGHFSTQYDVSPDGQRIYFLDRRRDPPPSEIGVVLDWRAFIK